MWDWVVHLLWLLQIQHRHQELFTEHVYMLKGHGTGCTTRCQCPTCRPALPTFTRDLASIPSITCCLCAVERAVRDDPRLHFSVDLGDRAEEHIDYDDAREEDMMVIASPNYRILQPKSIHHNPSTPSMLRQHLNETLHPPLPRLSSFRRLDLPQESRRLPLPHPLPKPQRNPKMPIHSHTSRPSTSLIPPSSLLAASACSCPTGRIWPCANHERNDFICVSSEQRDFTARDKSVDEVVVE
jgi:hypothetical protein